MTAIALAASAPALGQKAEACLACHGADGVSRTPLAPSLGGQPAFYVMAQLFLFREGRRGDPVMLEQAKGLSDAELSSLSERIARLAPPPPPAEAPDAGRYQRGRAIAEQRRCTSCHGADLTGGRNVPRLANQREDYSLKALAEYRSGARVGYGNAVMPETVSGLSDAELSDLAHFIAYFRR